MLHCEDCSRGVDCNPRKVTRMACAQLWVHFPCATVANSNLVLDRRAPSLRVQRETEVRQPFSYQPGLNIVRLASNRMMHQVIYDSRWSRRWRPCGTSCSRSSASSNCGLVSQNASMSETFLMIIIKQVVDNKSNQRHLHFTVILGLIRVEQPGMSA